MKYLGLILSMVTWVLSIISFNLPGLYRFFGFFWIDLSIGGLIFFTLITVIVGAIAVIISIKNLKTAKTLGIITIIIALLGIFTVLILFLAYILGRIPWLNRSY